MANLVVRVVDAEIKRAKETGKRLEIVDDQVEGLRIRITPAGSATWVLGCRDSDGRARRFPLGTYDKDGGMTVAAARDAARLMRADVAKGADPIATSRRKRLATKNATEGIGTLKATIELYGSQHGKTLRTWPECRKRIESIFAPYLNRPMTALTRRDLQLSADHWRAPQSAAAAVRYLRPVLKWAADRGYADEDLARVKPPAKVGRRDRLLSHAELAAILPVLRSSDGPYPDAFRFMLLTLARREEVAGAAWRDVDLDAATWTIPAEASKNKQPHIVPLSKQAAALLRARRPHKAKPGELVFANGAGGRIDNWDRETKRIMEASSTEGWTRHDLRRTGATMLGEMGVLPDIIEATLNHVSIRSQLAATYNRSRYRPQVAEALQRLADALDKIEQGNTQAALKTENPDEPELAA